MSGWDARRTYLYLTSLVTLIIAIFGIVGLARDVVSLIYPQPSYVYEMRPEPWIKTPADTMYTRAEIDSMKNESRRDERARQRYQRAMDMAQHITMLIVAVPLFLWHIRQAQRAEPR